MSVGAGSIKRAAKTAGASKDEAGKQTRKTEDKTAEKKAAEERAVEEKGADEKAGSAEIPSDTDASKGSPGTAAAKKKSGAEAGGRKTGRSVGKEGGQAGKSDKKAAAGSGTVRRKKNTEEALRETEKKPADRYEAYGIGQQLPVHLL